MEPAFNGMIKVLRFCVVTHLQIFLLQNPTQAHKATYRPAAVAALRVGELEQCIPGSAPPANVLTREQ